MIEKYQADAKPREIIYHACLLLPIIALVYIPSWQQYLRCQDSGSINKVRSALPIIAQQRESSLNPSC